MWLSFGDSEQGGAELSGEASLLDFGTLAHGDANWSGRADGILVPSEVVDRGTACGPGQQRPVS